ncbi:MAG: DsbC family protein [Ectothiorhodospiraceae bacterium]|nr:DsbC family protein [Chromatiales bacterium]MCP5154474.1 DsbC family protein [Ectothiorhodospiraceae bacterium]
MQFLRRGAALLLLVSLAHPTMGADTETVRQRLVERLGGSGVESIQPAPVPGLYQVGVGGRILYVSEDARYVLSGRLIDLETRADLTEEALTRQRMTVLGQLDEEKMIVFEPTVPVRHTITTFTDIDCGYCRRMHSEIEALGKAGIRVRYMFYPRAGIPSDSFDKAVSVWCADDRQSALTAAKAGQTPPKRECDNPIREHMSLARAFDLSGTPMTITDTGEKIGGYMPPDALAKRLDASKALASR